MGSNSMPSAMPDVTGGTFVMGPTPTVTPTPSRAGSARHGSAEHVPHSDVFGRRMPGGSPATSGVHSRANSPRTHRARSGPTHAEEDERDDRRSERFDRRQERTEDPVGVKLRLEAIEMTLRVHTNEMGMIKSQTQEICTKLMKTDADHQEVVRKLDRSFNDWNIKLTAIEANNERIKGDFQPLMELFASRLDKLEADFATMMSSSGSAPGLHPNVDRHDIGSPGAPGTPPGATGAPSNSWSPLNPQRNDSYGHQPRSQPDQGDPWSQPRQGAPAATYGGWQAPNFANGAGSNVRPFDARDWTVDKKASHELKSFNGDITNYDNWRRRIRDHFTQTNMFYKEIFDLVEAEKGLIQWDKLKSLTVASLPNLDWQWISSQIWSFTGRFMSDTLFGRRLTLAGGQEFNGLELWRSLYMENMGGSVEMKVAERNFFINFPQCTKEDELQTHLGQWMQLHQKYGSDLPDAHVQIMFHNTLPANVLADLRKMRELDTLQKQITWVYSELGRYTDTKLSKWNTMRLEKQLKAGPKNATGVNQLRAEGLPDSEVSSSTGPDLEVLQASLELSMQRMVNAAFSKDGKTSDRGRSERRTPTGSRNSSGGSRGGTRSHIPSPKFAGCWCCGEEGHSRQKCPKFIAIKAKNGGKVPKDYEGAYEKSMKKLASKPSVPIKALRSRPQEVESFECAETYVWPMISAPTPSRAPRSPPTMTHNRYDDLGDSDEDESEVMQALAQLTSNVQLKSATPQGQRKRKAGKIDMAHIKSVAQQVINGNIRLPDLNLDSNSEYDCCWALVDSGAGVNCGTKKQFPSAVPCEAPSITLTTADGKRMNNQGAMKVTTKSREGIVTERIFYDAPVEMPILSVAGIAQEGTLGSTTAFRLKDGYIENNENQQRQHFVKRKGVYFMKLYTKRRVDNDPSDVLGFARPVKP